jgi:hypothetical protein
VTIFTGIASLQTEPHLGEFDAARSAQLSRKTRLSRDQKIDARVPGVTLERVFGPLVQESTRSSASRFCCNFLIFLHL